MEIIEKLNNWKPRASRSGEVMTLNELTEKQKETLEGLQSKVTLTAKQQETLTDLVQKRDSTELSQTYKSYLIDEYNRLVYGYDKSFTSKYTDKGNETEEDCIDLLQDTILSNHKPLIKNKERFDSEFTIGTPDLIYNDIVFDIKSKWDWDTFQDSAMTKTYESQGRAYMYLLNKNGISAYKFVLVCCLVNMPLYMIEAECRKKFYYEAKYLSMQDPEYLKMCEELAEMYNFDKFPKEQRVKLFEIERSLAWEAKLEEQVKKGRQWLVKYHEEKINYSKYISGLKY